MKYSVPLLSILHLTLLGCSEKPENKSGSSTPVVQEVKKPNTTKTQQLPDTIHTIGNLAWHSNVKEAFTLAEKDGKNVIIMVGEDDCRWCMKMKKNTLSDRRIQERMQAYILVSVKRSDKEAVRYVPEFDGNIPSFFFMDRNREVIEPVVGYFKSDDFLDYIKEIEEL